MIYLLLLVPLILLYKTFSSDLLGDAEEAEKDEDEEVEHEA